MKKILWSFLLLSAAARLSQASSVVLVYENEQAAIAGASFLGSLVSDGLVVAADRVSTAKNAILAAPVGERLRTTALVRLDLQLNTAFLKFGDPVANAAAQQAHAKRSASFKSFLPEGGIATAAAAADAVSVPQIFSSQGPFELKINGQAVGPDAIVLKKRLKKSKFKLDIVNVSTASLWNVEVELVSEPKLSFWKEGRKSGLNDVPQHKFKYGQQIMFKPLGQGSGIQVPIEVFFIEDEDYVLTFKISSKDVTMEQRVAVKFKSL